MNSADTQELERVVLTGFMGSGKTTVGKLLAQRLGWSFADLDDHVVFHEGLGVPEIFAQHGEAYFRQAELAALGVLLTRSRVVIALGGGAPETPALRELLGRADGSLVVHLHAPFELLYGRCMVQSEDPSATERPLARERAAAAARYDQRQTAYGAIAHHTADAGLDTPHAVVDAILALLPSHLLHV